MFPEELQYHVAPYIASFVKWLTVEWSPCFDSLSNLLLGMLLQVEYFLKWVPWWGWILFVVVISWYLTRDLLKTLLPGVLIFTIGLFGLWEVGMETLGIVIVAVLISLVLGIPLGIAMANSDRFNAINTPILDAMQTMPAMVYLIPALMLFQLGRCRGNSDGYLFAAPVIRLTNLGSARFPMEAGSGPAFAPLPGR